MQPMTSEVSVTLQVSLGERTYPITIGSGLLGDTECIAAYLSSPRLALVSNDTLWPLYAGMLQTRLESAGYSVVPIVLPDGEEYKSWESLNAIYDALLENHCDRQTTLVALGGGVIGDITGFAAATYQRGVPFIQIPTTLLAQVDSSVGGKTAINHPRGKNMVGAFYQPRLVLADTDTLKTLPEREYRSGIAEVIKYGLILDYAFFAWIEANIGALLDRQPEATAYAIRRSCEIKASVVAADERELVKDGGRALLNLGHTFGHAIESALGYGTWLHGEAVGCGMALAAGLSTSIGLLDASECDRIVRLIERSGLSTRLPGVSNEELLENMGRDKKNEGGAIRLILLSRIGEAIVDTSISSRCISDFLALQPRQATA